MKKQLSRRDFLRLSVVGGGGVLLAACAPQVVEKTVRETVEVEKIVTEVVEVAKEVEKEVVVTATPAPIEQADLVFWNYWGDIEPIFLAMIDMFMDRYPNVDVKYELLPWDQYWQKLNATLVTGNPPDVWYTAPTFYFEYVERGQLVDLSPYVEVDTDIAEDDWYPKSIDMWRALESQHIFGLPSDFVAQVVFYNKDLFDAAGLEYPAEDWTWDDFLGMAKTLTRVGSDGKTEVWGCVSPAGWHLDQIIESNGGEVIDDDQTMCMLTDGTAAIDTIQFMVDMIDKHKVSPPAGEFEGMGSPFLTGRLAIDFGLEIGQIQYKDAPFGWSNQLIPVGSAKRVNYGGANGFVVSSPTEAPDASYTLVKFLTAQAGPILYIGTGLIPVRKDLAAAPAFLQQPPPPDDYSVWAKAVEYSDHNYGRGYNEWQSAKNNALQAAFLGDVTVEEAVEDACQGMDAALAKIAEERASGV